MEGFNFSNKFRTQADYNTFIGLDKLNQEYLDNPNPELAPDKPSAAASVPAVSAPTVIQVDTAECNFIEKLENLEVADDPDNIFIDLFNIFNVYYKTLYNRNPSDNLFAGIDTTAENSTNRPSELFYDAVHKYNTAPSQNFTDIFDPETYKEEFKEIPEDYPLYMIQVESEVFVTHSLLSALYHIATYDWVNISWSINQVSEF